MSYSSPGNMNFYCIYLNAGGHPDFGQKRLKFKVCQKEKNIYSETKNSNDS